MNESVAKRPSFLRRTFSALAHRDFRNLMLGNGISNIGSWMQLVAQPWLVLTLTGSSFMVGLDGFLGHLPSFIFLIPGGIIADRHNRKKIMIASQIVQMASAALIALLVVLGKVEVWMILVLSFAVGTAQAFSFPAYQAMVAGLVPREELGNAISLNSMQFNLSRIVGPLLAGSAMATIGAAWCFGLNSLSFVALLIAIACMQHPMAKALPIDQSQPRPPISEGFKVILGNRKILGVLLLVAAGTFFAGPLSTFLPVLVREVFHGGAGAFSTSVAIFGSGALVGAFAAAAQSRHLGIRLAVITSLAMGCLMFFVAAAPTLWVADVILFFGGLFMITSSSSANTFLQSSLGNEFRARVASFFLLAIRGGMALGNLTTGWGAEHFGTRGAMAANGFMAVTSTALIWWFLLREPEASSNAAEVN